jgi:hypothetical protein
MVGVEEKISESNKIKRSQDIWINSRASNEKMI